MPGVLPAGTGVFVSSGTYTYICFMDIHGHADRARSTVVMLLQALGSS